MLINIKKIVQFRLEAFVLGLVLFIFASLPLSLSSNIGSWLARKIGPILQINQRARLHIRKCIHGLSPKEMDRLLDDMWDNLGRIAGELPHLKKFRQVEIATNPGDIEILGEQNINNLGNGRGAALLFSAHLGNWEILTTTCDLVGLKLFSVYRAANNSHVDRILNNYRTEDTNKLIPKGSGGAKKILTLLREGHAIGLLVDQKMNDGISVPFFGTEAMTPPALAQLSQRYDLPIISVRCERLEGPRFRITFEKFQANQLDTLSVMTSVNELIEDWICSRPSQWLWLHRRWPK